MDEKSAKNDEEKKRKCLICLAREELILRPLDFPLLFVHKAPCYLQREVDIWWQIEVFQLFFSAGWRIHFLC